MRLSGDGLPQYYKKAYMWLNFAIYNGVSNGQKTREIASEILSHQDLIEAQDTTLTVASTPSDINYIANDAPLATSVNTGIFQPWKPGVIKIPNAQAHPTTLAEGIAMASLRPPMPSYRPRLDQKLIKDGILSDAQLETIIHAGEAHSQVLPQRFIFGEEQGKEMIFTTEDEDGFKLRQGFFLGDGTGAGKGRSCFYLERGQEIWVSLLTLDNIGFCRIQLKTEVYKINRKHRGVFDVKIGDRPMSVSFLTSYDRSLTFHCFVKGG